MFRVLEKTILIMSIPKELIMIIYNRLNSDRKLTPQNLIKIKLFQLC